MEAHGCLSLIQVVVVPARVWSVPTQQQCDVRCEQVGKVAATPTSVMYVMHLYAMTSVTAYDVHNSLVCISSNKYNLHCQGYNEMSHVACICVAVYV